MHWEMFSTESWGIFNSFLWFFRVGGNILLLCPFSFTVMQVNIHVHPVKPKGKVVCQVDFFSLSQLTVEGKFVNPQERAGRRQSQERPSGCVCWKRMERKTTLWGAPLQWLQGWLPSPHGSLSLDAWPCLVLPGYKGIEEEIWREGYNEEVGIREHFLHFFRKNTSYLSYIDQMEIKLTLVKSRLSECDVSEAGPKLGKQLWPCRRAPGQSVSWRAGCGGDLRDKVVRVEGLLDGKDEAENRESVNPWRVSLIQLNSAEHFMNTHCVQTQNQLLCKADLEVIGNMTGKWDLTRRRQVPKGHWGDTQRKGRP